MSKYINFNVLTSKRPNKGFYDETLPENYCKRVYRYGSSLPAVLSGVYLSIRSLFIRANKYIYTSPPESLFIGAYINRLLGRQVYIDSRDIIDRETQRIKWLVPIYKWLYKRIKNVVVCHKFVDESKLVIHSGYEDVKLNKAVRSPKYFTGFVNHEKYLKLLSNGYIEDYEKKYQKELYKNGNRQRRMDGSLSMITARHLGLKLNEDWFHPDCFNFEPQSWEEVAKQMKRFLNE
ncbi:MAG: hypothetical protein ACFE95_02690 [Candidatus Hodarchaeota archaeon]